MALRTDEAYEQNKEIAQSSENIITGRTAQNAAKRKWYAELGMEKKAAILKKRRETYAEKNKQTRITMPPVQINTTPLQLANTINGSEAVPATAAHHQNANNLVSDTLDKGKQHICSYSSVELELLQNEHSNRDSQLPATARSRPEQNATKRKWYTRVGVEKKASILKKRRETYAERKNQTRITTPMVQTNATPLHLANNNNSSATIPAIVERHRNANSLTSDIAGKGTSSELLQNQHSNMDLQNTHAKNVQPE